MSAYGHGSGQFTSRNPVPSDSESIPTPTFLDRMTTWGSPASPSYPDHNGCCRAYTQDNEGPCSPQEHFHSP